jgi:hypothetical protein
MGNANPVINPILIEKEIAANSALLIFPFINSGKIGLKPS